MIEKGDKPQLEVTSCGQLRFYEARKTRNYNSTTLGYFSSLTAAMAECEGDSEEESLEVIGLVTISQWEETFYGWYLEGSYDNVNLEYSVHERKITR